MEKENSEDRSKVVLAIILIAIGGIWLFRQVGLHYFLTEPFFHPFALMFGQLGKIIFSWQVIMIIVGLALLAGNRNGWVFIIIGAIFLVPKIFIIPAFSFALMLPILLIVAGIVMIIRKN